jgi:hypothetical protein
MAHGQGREPDHLPRALFQAAKEGWPTTMRLALLALIVEIPLVLASLLWLILGRLIAASRALSGSCTGRAERTDATGVRP